MKKSVKIAIGAVVIVAAGAAAASGLKPKNTENEAVAPPAVRVENPSNGTIELFRSLIGTVEPADQVYVIPKAAGEITAVYVNPGDYVEEGQLLCEIDTKQVDGAKLQLESAEIQLKDAQTNLERMKVLYASGDISSQSYEQVESAAKGAQIAYDSAKLAYDNQVEFSSITATIAGKIESSSMEVHGMASSASPLCVIAGEGAKSVSFSVTEAVLDQVHVGEQIKIEKNGSDYAGTVTEVNTMVDAATGLFKVKATVEDNGSLISGSSVKLYITSDKVENVMTIPVDAVYYSNGEPYVYTYDNGTVHKVTVETGISDDEKMQILSGLSADNEVITTWDPELYEGAPAVLAGETGTTVETVETTEAAKTAEATETTEAAETAEATTEAQTTAAN